MGGRVECAGKGEMLFKLFNVYTMISDNGWAIDQWGLYRYLTEAVYFPTALLPSQHVRWEPVDKNSARCVLMHGSVSASAVFHVTKSGALDTMFTPKRIRCGPLCSFSIGYVNFFLVYTHAFMHVCSCMCVCVCQCV